VDAHVVKDCVSLFHTCRIKKALKLKGGDKLVMITCKKRKEVYCVTMIKADELADGIRKKFSPLTKELFK